jgi:hypothetical protein
MSASDQLRKKRAYLKGWEHGAQGHQPSKLLSADMQEPYLEGHRKGSQARDRACRESSDLYEVP